ncbi:hypothetical protein D3C71_1840920 [compost metagenome]
MQARVAEAGGDEARSAFLVFLRKAQHRQRGAIDILLGLHARRAVGQRDAFDARVARAAQRRHGGVYAGGDGLAAVGIDDVKRVAHGLPSGTFRGFAV